VHPLVSARLAALLHPIGAVILGMIGPGAITAFAVLQLSFDECQAGRAVGDPPAPSVYRLRSGIIGAPVPATQAASPLLFGPLMDCMGTGVLAICVGLNRLRKKSRFWKNGHETGSQPEPRSN
jgi:hypothetical protein